MVVLNFAARSGLSGRGWFGALSDFEWTRGDMSVCREMCGGLTAEIS